MEHLEVPAEVAVGQRAEILQVVEEQALGVGDQRREDAQPGLLVDDPLEPVVGEPAAARRARFYSIAMVPFQGPVEHSGREELAAAEGEAHRPGGERRTRPGPGPGRRGPATR